jgi:hypothetical protein
MTKMAPAFKEWSVIVEALGAGAQTLILRKGGIAEGKNGFAPQHDRFWLFPTQFHQQLEKTKPEAARFNSETPDASGTARLLYWAEVTDTVFIADEELIPKLNPFHLWKEEVIRERFHYRQPGLYLFIVRTHRAPAPVEIAVTAQMEGCKSWLEVPVEIPSGEGIPALLESDFAPQRKRILQHAHA